MPTCEVCFNSPERATRDKVRAAELKRIYRRALYIACSGDAAKVRAAIAQAEDYYAAQHTGKEDT